MSKALCGTIAAAIVGCVICSLWSAPPSSSQNLSQVVSTADLAAELQSDVSEIEAAVSSPEALRASSNKLRLAAVRLTVVAQALAEHDDDSPLRSKAPSIRDAAIQLGSSGSFEETRRGIDRLRRALEGQGTSDSKVSFDWAKLGRTRTLMDALRERTDQVRKALRRSKDAVAESRHASTMAVLMLAVAAHAHEKQTSDESDWRNWSIECQQELTKTAAALKQQDQAAVLEHFTAAQSRCDKCHETFKK